jgi:beta-lactamase superfamily II metal-dependent hydrolase
VLACGHGDTILLRLAGPRWGLIDCHLESRAAKQKFFAMAEALGIRRLEFIILTHPDFDHYAGMVDIVEHFTRDGREIGLFYDTGMNWVDVTRLMEAKGLPDDEIDEYARLFKTITLSTIEPLALHEDHCPITIRGTPLKLVPIAPPETAVTRPARRALIGEKPGIDVNDLSIVLVLTFAELKRSRKVLLAADAKTETLMQALEIWREHPDNPEKIVGFDAVKVPHHGSGNGHCKEVCSCGPQDCKGTAVISVGNKFRLPKATVLRDFFEANWTVLSTTTRRLLYRPNRLIELFGRPPAAEIKPAQHDITLTWTTAESLQWAPPEAEIVSSELGNYFS